MESKDSVTYEVYKNGELMWVFGGDSSEESYQLSITKAKEYFGEAVEVKRVVKTVGHIRTVKFDDTGFTLDCPISGETCISDCEMCEFHNGIDGFEVICTHSPSYNEDDWRKDR